MSLVNKMLRDLDARHVADGDRAALPPAVTPLAAHRESARSPRWVLPFLALVLAAAGAVGWYVVAGRYAEAPQPASTPTVVSPAPTPAPIAPIVGAPPEPATPAAGNEVAGGPGLAALRLSDRLAAAPAGIQPLKTPEARPAPVATPPVPVSSAPAPVRHSAPAEARIDMQLRVPSPGERADTEYRRGLAALRQGDPEGAAAAYRAVLDIQPEHGAARLALASVLIDARRFEDAEEVLRKGMELASVRLPSTLAWARLKVERNQPGAALDMLLKNAAAGERSAEYQGFAGALLNRAGRAAEAVEHYQAATRLAPGESRWWAGLGIALDAAGKAGDAQEAYRRARSLPGLPPDLAQHIEQRLR